MGNMSNIDERVCDTIVRDTYVDDITTGGDDVADAFNVYNGITNFLAKAHFKIHKWATNSPALLEKIPEQDRAPTRLTEDGTVLEARIRPPSA